MSTNSEPVYGMSDAFRDQMKHMAGSFQTDRSGWTDAQWVADARELMGGIDGSVSSLLNGHIMALFRTLDGAREAKGTSVVQAASDIASSGILPFERALRGVIYSTDVWEDYDRLKREDAARQNALIVAPQSE